MSAAGHSADQKRRLNKSIVWNLAGNGVPLLVAVISIPLLIQQLGNERFGLLTIAWTLVGYFSLFDFGLGKALTKAVSQMEEQGAVAEIPEVAGATIFIMAAFGVVAGAALALASPFLISNTFKISSSFQNDAILSIVLLGLAVPGVIVCAALIGLLEAYQKFQIINLVRAPLGISNFLGPLIALQVADRLSIAVGAIVFFRIVALFAYFKFAKAAIGGRLPIRADFSRIGPLLRFGGWASVSNLISPVMVYFDRFIIAGIFSVAVMAYYTTPYELISRASIASVSILAVFFPAMARAAVSADALKLHQAVRHAFSLVFAIINPVAAISIAFSFLILHLWINAEFASNSGLILQVLAAGVFANSLARVPFGLLQAVGRADLTAKVNILEVIPYLLILYLFINKWGVSGAAFAWTARVVVDFIILSFVAGRVRPELQGETRKMIGVVVASLTYFLALGWVKSEIFAAVLILPALAFSANVLWNEFIADRPRVGS